MRMRFKPYARPELEACDFHAHDPFHSAGHWAERFARPAQPLMLELGCGKGGFLSQLAVAHPENNYMGFDITDKVLILAKRKIEAAYAAAGRPADNVCILSADIERIRNVMNENDRVRRIYINFCNPWSKNSSSNKHRLTYPRQLIQYRAFLEDGGEVWFKTDDDDLFRDSLGYFPAAGYAVTWQTADLHQDEPAWNIRTEHEGMFTEMGIPIKALIAKKLPGDESVTWTEPKKLAREAAEKEAQAAAARAPAAGDEKEAAHEEL
jgi:tRNA (guanine-N7-)-methyltransferase